MQRRTEHGDYDTAVSELAGALGQMWHACEGGGANFAEALSYALALTARDLVTEQAVDDAPGDGEVVDHELAVGKLVSQRPGSWEAAHVRDLTLRVDLLGAPQDIGPG